MICGVVALLPRRAARALGHRPRAWSCMGLGFLVHAIPDDIVGG